MKKTFRYPCSLLLWIWIFLSLQSLASGFQSAGIPALSSRCLPRICPPFQAISGNSNDHGSSGALRPNGARRSSGLLFSPFGKAWFRIRVFFQRHLYRLMGRKRWTQLQRRIRALTERYTVYVLECEQGKYYVGSTQNKKKRFHQHLVIGRGSVWTQKYTPIRVLKQLKRIPQKYALGMESKVTAETMWHYGINNVRGAMFCNVQNYTTKDLDSLTRFVGHYNDLSYRDVREKLREELPSGDSRRKMNSMGKQVHADDVCFNCGQKGHWASDCPHPSTQQQAAVNGSSTEWIVDEKTKEKVLWKEGELSEFSRRRNGYQKRIDHANDRCYRCGRLGHWAVNCPY